jgi:5-formyltetrahydrofolate cyclo-ligase
MDEIPEKRVTRESLLAGRAALDPRVRSAADAALVAAARELARAVGRVAAYVPLPDEPAGTLPAGAGLVDALVEVLPPGGLLLPVLLADRDLDWVAYDGSLAAGTTLPRLREPPGARLGVTAIADVDLVFVPALAVDRTGVRLGRGGGSYDRALTRVRPGVPVVALLYADEWVTSLPAEPHDQPVTAVLTPEGLNTIQAP